MGTAVACKLCGFQVEIGLHEGRLSSVAPDQRRMKKRCRKAVEPGFAYDCSNITSALLAILEREANSQLSGLSLSGSNYAIADMTRSSRVDEHNQPARSQGEIADRRGSMPRAGGSQEHRLA